MGNCTSTLTEKFDNLNILYHVAVKIILAGNIRSLKIVIVVETFVQLQKVLLFSIEYNSRHFNI